MFQFLNTTKKQIVFMTVALLHIGTHAPLQAEATSPTPQPQTNAYQTLMNLHIPALAIKAAEESKKAQEQAKENSANAKNLFNLLQVTLPPVQEVEKLQVTYRIFSDSETSQQYKNSDIVSLNTLQDLEMFCGYSGQLQNYVFKSIDQTQTTFGSVQLQKMLLMPQDSAKKLRHQQEIIQTLVNDEKLFTSLATELDKIKVAEQELLWFWQQMEDVLEQFMAGLNLPSFTKLDKNPAALQAWTTFGTVISPGLFFALDCFYLNNLIKGINGDRTQIPVVSGIMVAYFSLLTALMTYGAAIKIKRINTLHGKVNGVAGFACATEELGNIMNNHAQLKALFPIHKLLQGVASPLTPETTHLLSLLKTDTFKSDPTMFSYQGRVLAAFNEMLNTKNQFISAMRHVGQLDAYMSIARLYKKYQTSQHARFCFVDYLEQEKPYVAIQDFWLPSLNPDTVVLNSIELGTQTGPRSTTITGPNAGGKSTSLKSITLAVLLAQSFGIAPARAMSLKPFAKINTYMNITDTAGTASLFQAEMRRTQALLQTIKTLAPNQSAFIVMDEIFTGTNAKEGEAGAYGVAKKLIGFDNCICMFATHFKRLTELAAVTNGIVENRKVCVVRNSDGSFTFPYKLEPGITDQAIALDLLLQEGFDQDILQAAYEIINEGKTA